MLVTPMLSVLIATKNEEENIKECIESVAEIAGEIVVVDSGSSDTTVALAQSMNAVVKTRPFDNFAAQKNFGLSAVSNNWVLLLDADERLTPGLRREIENVLKDSDTCAAYSVRRDAYFAGKRVRCWSGDHVVRLIQKDKCRFSPDHPVHERLVVEGNIGRLEGVLRHYTFRSFRQYLPKLEQFAQLAAEKAYREGKTASALHLLFLPPGRFLKTYILRGGIMDGVEGVMIAGLSAYATYLRYALLRELQQQRVPGDK